MEPVTATGIIWAGLYASGVRHWRRSGRQLTATTAVAGTVLFPAVAMYSAFTDERIPVQMPEPAEWLGINEDGEPEFDTDLAFQDEQ